MPNCRLKINDTNGLLEPVIYYPSNHCNERPAHMPISLIVVHGISLPPGQFGTGAIEQFFCGKLEASLHPYYQQIAHLQVSSHLLIKRAGEIIQFVPLHKRAWHAGISSYAGVSDCNDYSIGIELEGTDKQAYTFQQYQQLALICKLLLAAYPAITPARIVGHSDIAPGRKTDPGPAFNWNLLRGKLI
jgi:N-acetyl-anhydromuramoyl-L-alanine amidase